MDYIKLHKKFIEDLLKLIKDHLRELDEAERGKPDKSEDPTVYYDKRKKPADSAIRLDGGKS